MAAPDTALAAVCGTYCPECRFYGTKCEGCGAVQGKPFWVSQYGRDVCRMYGCCVNKKHLAHCGECEALPCQIFTESSDPSQTPEQARLSRENRISRLRLRARTGTAEWLMQQAAEEKIKE